MGTAPISPKQRYEEGTSNTNKMHGDIESSGSDFQDLTSPDLGEEVANNTKNTQPSLHGQRDMSQSYLTSPDLSEEKITNNTKNTQPPLDSQKEMSESYLTSPALSEEKMTNNTKNTWNTQPPLDSQKEMSESYLTSPDVSEEKVTNNTKNTPPTLDSQREMSESDSSSDGHAFALPSPIEIRDAEEQFQNGRLGAMIRGTNNNLQELLNQLEHYQGEDYPPSLATTDVACKRLRGKYNMLVDETTPKTPSSKMRDWIYSVDRHEEEEEDLQNSKIDN